MHQIALCLYSVPVSGVFIRAVAVRFLRNGTDYLGFCDFLKSDAYGVLKDVAVPLGLRRAGSWKRKPAADVENEVHAV